MPGMTDLERKVFRLCAIVGSALTLAVLVCDAMGGLGGLEKWLYDRRVADCQYFRKPPTDRLVHLDIDDKALDAIGQWPWPRATMADILEEISRAMPKAVGIDIIYSEPARPQWIPQPDGSFKSVNDDDAMATALSHLNVTIPVSVQLAPPKSVSTLDSAIVAELTANLELTPEQLSSRLRTRGFASEEVSAAISASFLPARREAMFQRISHELDGETYSIQQLQDRLLPDTDKTIHSPLRKLLEEQFDHVAAVKEASRFGLPNSLALPNMLVTVPNLMPIPEYSRAAADGGFVDVDNLSEPVVRSIPLLVSENNRILPQWGLAFGCAMIDADLSKAKITTNSLIVPSPHGDVVVPIRKQYSSTLKRDIPIIADVPWFGTSSWDTMYDWPEHKISKQHQSINSVWDICLTREKIRTNNASIDQAVEDVLHPGPEKFGLDEALWKKYLASKPDPEDVPARKRIIDVALKTMDDSGYSLESFSRFKPEELKPEEKQAYDLIKRVTSTTTQAMQQNQDLQLQLKQYRQTLASQLGGKGVLIGWTATSAVDFVTTSLHARCPGVVVHGAIANAVVTGQWWRTAPFWITGLLTILLGLFIALATGWLSPPAGVVTAIAAAVIYFLVNGVLLFDWGRWIVGAAGPLVAIALTWAACLVTRIITEGIDRRRKERDLAIFRHEMSLAKNVQVALIPKEMPIIDGIEPFGWTKPADETGGDLFDLWTLPDGRLGILVADASGHGLAPSVIVSQVRTLVRALSEIENHPNGLLARVNARLAQDLEPARFVTAFLGFLDSTGTLHWASAGHGPMLWCAKDGEEFQSLDATALPLGIMPDYMGDEIGPLQLDLSGMLIVTSDGIFEAPASNGEQFGIERVIETLKNYAGKSTIEISGAIRDAVTKWQTDPDKPVDDQTTVIIRRVAGGLNVTVIEDKSAVAATEN